MRLAKLLIIVSITFTITRLPAQEQVSSDSIKESFKEDLLVDFWQLHSNTLYDNFPDKIALESSVKKGKDYLKLSENGTYEFSINGVSSKGYWLRNNKLLVFKQKSPVTVDVYYEILQYNELTLKIKNQNKVLVFLSKV